VHDDLSVRHKRQRLLADHDLREAVRAKVAHAIGETGRAEEG
jgi:hypothetical protein